MRTIHDSRDIPRSADEVASRFAGPITGLLSTIIGPDEDTWRAETREGPVRVELLVHIGPAWVHPDGTHRRRFTTEPDPTSELNLLTATLTPRVEGELSLHATGPGTARLAFDGTTRSRSVLTGALERLVIGDPLSHSGIDTLLDTIAEQLTNPRPGEPSTGPHEGRIRFPVPGRKR